MIRFHSSHCRSSWRRKTTTTNFSLLSFLLLQHQSHAGATIKVSIHPESTCSTVKSKSWPRTCVHIHRNIKYRNFTDKFKILNIYDQNTKIVLSHKNSLFQGYIQKLTPKGWGLTCGNQKVPPNPNLAFHLNSRVYYNHMDYLAFYTPLCHWISWPKVAIWSRICMYVISKFESWERFS